MNFHEGHERNNPQHCGLLPLSYEIEENLRHYSSCQARSVRTRHSFLNRRITFMSVVLGWLWTVSLFANTLPEQLKPLVERSPFVPPGVIEKPVERQAPVPARKLPPIEAELEYRGHYNWKNSLRVSLFVRKENRGYWVTPGEKFVDYTLVSVNLKEPSLVIKRETQLDTLALKKPSNTPVAIPSNATKPPTNQGSPPPPGFPVQNADSSQPAAAQPPPRRRRIIIPNTQALKAEEATQQ